MTRHYATVRVCHSWSDLETELERARGADLVAKCSGVGGWDMELASGVLSLRRPGTQVAFWDVDAPQTLAAAAAESPAAGRHISRPHPAVRRHPSVRWRTAGRIGVRATRRATYCADLQRRRSRRLFPDPVRSAARLRRAVHGQSHARSRTARARTVLPRRALRTRVAVRAWRQWLGRRRTAAQRALDRPCPDERASRLELLRAHCA